MHKYAVRIQFKIRNRGRLTTSHIRPEYAENTLDQATLFDSREQAEKAADIALENMRGYTREIKAEFIVVE